MLLRTSRGPARWTRKPPATAPLDRGHHLCDGLVAAYLFNDVVNHNTQEAGLRLVRDLVTESPSRALSFASDNATPNTFYPYYQLDPYEQGPVVYSGSGTDFASECVYASYFTLPDAVGAILNGGAAATLIVRWKLRTASPTNASLTGTWNLQSNSLRTHYPYTDGNFYCATFLATNRATLTPSTLVDRAAWHQVAVVASPSRYEVYQNAISLGTGTAESTVAVASGARFAMNGVGNEQREGAFSQILLYKRALTTAEVASLSADPWQIVQQPSSRVFFDVAAAAAARSLVYSPMSAMQPLLAQ
jgi:hypothetical protein